MAVKRVFGNVRVCAAIIGHVELERGEADVEKILAAHIRLNKNFKQLIAAAMLLLGAPTFSVPSSDRIRIGDIIINSR